MYNTILLMIDNEISIIDYITMSSSKLQKEKTNTEMNVFSS